MNEEAWRGRFCIEVSPIPNILVIFGASGDLANRKLIPALFSLFSKNLLHKKSHIIGCARSVMNDIEFKTKVKRSLSAHIANINPDILDEFLGKLHYISGNYDDEQTYSRLLAKIKYLEKSIEEKGDNKMPVGRIFYLSTPPTIYFTIVEQLGKSTLTKENSDGIPWRNVVLEKPFGRDLNSAKELDGQLRSVLRERQIYRIDHYLGKETVQNILMLRFANVMFEPIWNNKYIDNVQITVGESVGIGERAGYYDSYGHLRDMFQNHILQMLTLVAMEPPTTFDASHIRNEKVKVLEAIKPFPINELNKYILRGQYETGEIDGEKVKGYLDENNIPEGSKTESFVAGKFLIDNWRWKGVPFYMRSGKRMNKRLTEIKITFKKVPHSIFNPIQAEDLSPNVLTLNVQPEEGIALSIQAKQPGPKLCMGDLTMNFKYSEIFGGAKPEAYERLLLDSMLGDQTLFIRNDFIDLSWKLFTPVLEAWEKSDYPLYKYKAGSWGPDEVCKLLQQDGFCWCDCN